MLLRKEVFPFLRTLPLWKFYHEGSSIRTAMNYSFSTLNINSALDKFIQSERTIELLNQKGISELFPIQFKTYDHIFEGRDVLAGDKTGSGKTMAFSIPVIEKMRKEQIFKKEKGIKFVILAPTRELANQIKQEVDSLKHSVDDFRSIAVFGGLNVMLNIKELAKQPDILVGTPGRVLDLYERGCLNFTNTGVVCVDEADHMFDIGFKEHVDKILQQIKTGSQKSIQFICFSATLNKEVTNLTEKYMKKDKVHIKLLDKSESKVPKTITHYYSKTFYYDKVAAIRHLIKTFSKEGRVIVFTNKKAEADELSKELNINNVALHGDVTQDLRLKRLQLFKEGKVKVMIASDVASRGLDIPNVELVINYGIPEGIEKYVHRSGRTGRAGKDGVSVTLTIKDKGGVPELRDIEKSTGVNFQKYTISEEQIEEANNMMPEENQIENEAEYYEDRLILFADLKPLKVSDIANEIRKKGITTKYIKETVNANSGKRTFFIHFMSPQEAQQILTCKIAYPNPEDGYFNIQRSKIKQRVNFNK